MSNDILHNVAMITQCCREVSALEGDAAEIGVYRGHGAKLICKLLPESTVYLFDTFTGFPREMLTLPIDKHWTGRSFTSTSVDIVKQTLNGHDNRLIFPGVFPATAAGLSPRLRFVHIDCDVYLSTKAALEWCWPLLVPGGVVLDDDYGSATCGGAKQAVDEFCQANRLPAEVKLFRAILRRPV